ncbi:hypothetical protein ABPG74_011205 [Tetrahymena malaccensis]
MSNQEIKDLNAGDIMEKYVAATTKFVENNSKISNMKLYTLNKMNETAHAHFKKNQDKVDAIEQEVKAANQQYDILRQYFKQIDDVGQSIEGMESSVEYLDVILSRIESKINDLESMK